MHNDHAPETKQIRWVLVGDDPKAIIEGISDSAIGKPYVVHVQAGVYNIGDNTITVPSYVHVVGQGPVIFDYTGVAAKNAFTLATGSRLTGITIQNHLSSQYAIDIGTTGSYVLDDIVFIDCTRCIAVQEATASVTLRSLTFLPFSQSMTTGIIVTQGNVTIDKLTVGGSQSVTNALQATGSNAKVHVRQFLSVVNASVGYGIRAESSASVEGDTIDIHGATSAGIYARSAARIRLGSGELSGCAKGLDVADTDTEIGAYGLVIRNSTTNDVDVGSGAKLYGMGLADSSTFNVHPDAEFLIAFLDIFENDEALAISAEIHNGSPSRGREACFAEGDSYVNGMLVYTRDDSSVFVNKTTEAKSASGSTFTFPNNNVNSAIYVGSQVLLSGGGYHQFQGIKFLSTIAQVGGTIICEYPNGQTGSITAFADAGGGQITVTSNAHGLSTGDVVTIKGTTSYNGTFVIANALTNTFEITATWVADDATGTWEQWVEVNTNTVESFGKAYRKADSLFTVAANSYQVMFDPAMLADWTANDDPAIGASYNWVRFRITSTLTTAPTFQQFKCHSNRQEINADAFREMFGSGRVYLGISVPWSSFQDAGGTLADQDLWLTTNCKAGFINNVFNSDGDSVGTVFTLPSWVDTSGKMKVRCILVSSTTGTLDMIAWLNSSKDGDTISTTDPVSTTGEQSVTVSKSVTAGEHVTFDFELDISAKGIEGDNVSPELLWLNLEADSRPGNIYGAHFQVELLQNRDGAHI